MICFVSNQRPYSIQSEGKGKYQERLVQDFKSYHSLYPNIPVSNSIYSKILYIHRKNSDIDVDNMSKPFIDAFRKIIYTDDSIIDHRICTKIKLDDFVTLNIDISSLPEPIFSQLDAFIQEKTDHILYLEIGKFDSSMIKVGEENEIG